MGRRIRQEHVAPRSWATSLQGTVDSHSVGVKCSRCPSTSEPERSFPASISGRDPGVSVANFLRTAINARRAEPGVTAGNAAEARKNDMPIPQFRKLLAEKMKLLEIDDSFITRSVNDGFSGGEKKRLETLQMHMFGPTLALMDETDSARIDSSGRPTRSRRCAGLVRHPPDITPRILISAAGLRHVRDGVVVRTACASSRRARGNGTTSSERANAGSLTGPHDQAPAGRSRRSTRPDPGGLPILSRSGTGTPRVPRHAATARARQVIDAMRTVSRSTTQHPRGV